MTQSSVQTLIPALAPFITWLVKMLVEKFSSRVPGSLWPLICTGLGTLGEYITAYATNGTPSLWTGLALGAAGVGVRELFNQVPKTADDVKYGTNKTPLIAALLLFFVAGCAMNTQRARTPIFGPTGTNSFGVIGYKDSKVTSYVLINADNSYKNRVQNGSVQTIGSSGDQKAEGVQMIEAAFAGAGNMMAQYRGQAATATTVTSGTVSTPVITDLTPEAAVTLLTSKGYPATYKVTSSGDEVVCWTAGGKTNCWVFPSK